MDLPKKSSWNCKSIIYSPSKTYEDLTVVVLFDGENTPRHTYVTSLSDINDHN